MSGAYWIGVDAGTSVAKVALVDSSGAIRAMASERTPISEPHPGWQEVDPRRLWDNVAGAIRRVLAESGVSSREIAGVGVTAAMVGAYVLDADGAPLRPGILWSDGRTGAMVERMAQDGALARIFRTSGCVMQTGCTLPVLRWLLDHEPETMARARTVFGAKDWLGFRLTGFLATDASEAAVAPGDARTQDRSAEMIELFGLVDHAHLLPPVKPSGSLLGHVTAEAAQATGLRPGTPVALAAGDVVASLVGAGATRPGDACTILGTTCLSGVVLDRPAFEPADVGLLFSMPGPLWFRAMVNVAGTTTIDWAIRSLCPDLGAPPQVFSRLEALAERSPPGANGALFQPYLSDLGIIAPVVAAHLRGGFRDLVPRHGRADLVRAVYEGMAYAIRDCLEALPERPGRLVLCGGGGRSRFWAQAIADATGLAVSVPLAEEPGALGAAILAGRAIGKPLELSSERTRWTLSPDPAARPAYDAAFRRFVALREADALPI